MDHRGGAAAAFTSVAAEVRREVPPVASVVREVGCLDVTEAVAARPAVAAEAGLGAVAAVRRVGAADHPEAVADQSAGPAA